MALDKDAGKPKTYGKWLDLITLIDLIDPERRATKLLLKRIREAPEGRDFEIDVPYDAVRSYLFGLMKPKNLPWPRNLL